MLEVQKNLNNSRKLKIIFFVIYVFYITKISRVVFLQNIKNVGLLLLSF